MREIAFIILILLYFMEVRAGFPAPEWLRSLRSHHGRGTLRQTGRQEGREIDILGLACVLPLPFCDRLAVACRQIGPTKDLGQPAAALEEPLGFGGHLA